MIFFGVSFFRLGIFGEAGLRHAYGSCEWKPLHTVDGFTTMIVHLVCFKYKFSLLPSFLLLSRHTSSFGHAYIEIYNP